MTMRSAEMNLTYAVIVPLILVLVGSSIGTAYATNVDYNFGFKYGKYEWQSCTYRGDEDKPCESGSGICADTWNNAVTTVSNETECIVGFVASYNSICNPAQVKT